MYVDVNLFSLQKNGRFAAVWLAATNKTLFRRYIKRGQCEKIDIDDICKLIIDCANTNKPLIMVAKLAYGAVYIYQQQVQFLYDKVSTAACHQTAALLDLRHSYNTNVQNSSATRKHASRVKSNLEERYDECLADTILSPEEIILQLLADKRSTNVTSSDDITLREPTIGTLCSITETTLHEDNGFGEMKLPEYNEFLGTPSVDSSQNATRHDSSIAEYTTDVGESVLDDLSQSVDQTIRGTSITEPQLDCPSMDIIDMPIASTSLSQLQPVHDSSGNDGHYLAVDQHFYCLDEDTTVTTPPQSSTPLLSENSKNLQPCTTRKSHQRHSNIDKKTKLDFKHMKRAIEDCSKTRRCKNPRFDIIPLMQIRYPFDIAMTILQHPVRNMRSSLLPSLFTRNARKRNMDIEDILQEQWYGDLEIKKRKISRKEPALTRPIERPLPPKSPIDSGIRIHLDLNAIQNQEIEVIQAVQELAINEQISANDISLVNESTIACIAQEVQEFNETIVIDLLSRLWNKNECPASMKFVENLFSSRLAAASFFSTILVLIAKQMVRVSKNERNEIVDIQLQSQYN
ncbi:uncharacterized protein LOC135713973 [Ochlerotatus camptorhynchus]|uniref:uncharacterized protein LOC135713973 n=1 Tax=Ochlerotatus camptorhynchus TaxID=644619 RepID=UPI0031DD1542